MPLVILLISHAGNDLSEPVSYVELLAVSCAVELSPHSSKSARGAIALIASRIADSELNIGLRIPAHPWNFSLNVGQVAQSCLIEGSDAKSSLRQVVLVRFERIVFDDL